MNTSGAARVHNVGSCAAVSGGNDTMQFSTNHAIQHKSCGPLWVLARCRFSPGLEHTHGILCPQVCGGCRGRVMGVGIEKRRTFNTTRRQIDNKIYITQDTNINKYNNNNSSHEHARNLGSHLLAWSPWWTPNTKLTEVSLLE